ncbi:MAG: CBS domain-containing protein [Candidatus Zixiibacteriota bacterium]|nr:MAG: CBS domain-containing protein [candidate division Zixibacteria bacterium]
MSAPIIRVRDIMQKEVLSIGGMASAKQAAAMMRESNVSELLVAKRNEDDAWGIVTIMDLIKEVIVPGRDAESVHVYEIMTKPVIAIPAQMDIRYAIRLIQQIGVHRAPVEDQGKIVGMLTLSSLIRDHDIL